MLLFALPYAGVGASYYRAWPLMIGDVAVCPVQPPGRENRIGESPHRSHASFVADLAHAITTCADRPYALIGHCGAIPYALDLIWHMHRTGRPEAQRLIASSWGAPQHGLYGPLNFVDLATLDAVAEVRAGLGPIADRLPAEFVEIAADTLRLDLEIQRGYRYRTAEPLPCPVTVVGWTGDTVVPDEIVHDGWDAAARTRHRTLPGTHRDFADCPSVLRDLIVQELGGQP
jgi:surfactin synthase thioesterase subunit